MLTLSKSPFPSLPITISSPRSNTVAQPDITHQQERQIPALWGSCFVPRITNWIVWGSVIYMNTKMQSYSLLLYEVSTFILKNNKCCVVKWKCFGKTKMNSDCWASTEILHHRKDSWPPSLLPKSISFVFKLFCTKDTERFLLCRPDQFHLNMPELQDRTSCSMNTWIHFFVRLSQVPASGPYYALCQHYFIQNNICFEPARLALV